jgi:hypothetical protein
MPRSLIGLALLLVAGACGCQREEVFVYAPVSGKVTRHGTPLANVRVIFYADPESGTRGPRAFARTDASGQYHLRTDKGEDGAALGTHRVCLVGATGVPQFVRQRFEKEPQKVEQLAGKAGVSVGAQDTGGAVAASYGSVGETPLRAEVHAGSQTIDFDLP